MRVVLKAVLREASIVPAGDGARMELARRRSITISPKGGANVVLATRPTWPTARTSCRSSSRRATTTAAR